ncbi:hypothetical protein [Bacteroides rodentium]
MNLFLHYFFIRSRRFCKKCAGLLPSETWEELHTKHGAVEQIEYIYQVCETCRWHYAAAQDCSGVQRYGHAGVRGGV